MCEICDGKTYSDGFERVDDEIDEFGYSILTIEGGPTHPPWAYTIGLVEVFQHPEICVVGEPLDEARMIIDSLCGEVIDGRDVPPGKDAVLDEVVFHIDTAPQVALVSEMFTAWHLYYAWSGVDPPPDLSVLRLARCRAQHSPQNRLVRRAHRRRGHLQAVR